MTPGRVRSLLGACLLVCAFRGTVSADEADRIRVTTDRLHLTFASLGANPVEWRACHPACEAPGATSVHFTRAGDPPQARLAVHGPDGRLDLERLRYTAVVTEDDRARTLTFQSSPAPDGVQVVRTFEVSRHGDEVVMTVRVLGPGAAAFMASRSLTIDLDPGRDLTPPPTPGFSATLEAVRRVAIRGGDVRTLGAAAGALAVDRGDWVGFRSRFWALLAHPDGAPTVEPRRGDGVALTLRSEPGALAWRLVVYSGPVERASLVRADPALGGLLFSGLWSWLRALSLGLLHLLQALVALIGRPGPAIIALAVCVKILLLPLTLVAERLQDNVNTTQARLQPRIDAIKASLRGEAQARAIWALYREERVHPLYTLKSLLGFLIQVPVFIAVFDMLAEDFDLYHASFLWIADLSRPDALLPLPVRLPFFGQDLNLLPFLMSGLSVTAALRFASPVLTPALVRRQRRNLTLMAIAFFLLFYTFPAGMVLYWTSTNGIQLAAREVARLGRPRA